MATGQLPLPSCTRRGRRRRAGHDIGGHEVAIGTTLGGANVLDWMDMGAETEDTIGDLTLTEGLATYYISVRATDVLGNTGDPASSDGIKVAPLVARNPRCEGAGRRRGVQVARQSGRGRVRRPRLHRGDRQVVGYGGRDERRRHEPGDRLDIAGVLSATSQERSIAANYVKNVGSGAVVDPLFMIVGKVGGSAFGPAAGSVGGVGLNNVGLLVCVSRSARADAIRRRASSS